ncbi:MAG: hypothetical protein M9949_08770 [Candidatus Kapabacteria bacterium]|nr:hypothetical protein [Candidatus Kapabacteria bacterium]
MYIVLAIILSGIMNSCTGIRGIDDLYWKLTPTYRKFKAETKKEREFVQKIIDNPNQIVEIFENSDYYNPEYFDRTFPEFYTGPIHFIQKVKNLEISDFYKSGFPYRYNHLAKDMFSIDVKRKCHSVDDYDQYISFDFATIHGKVLLIDIAHFNG